jgi:hypothetical protein
LTTGARRTPHTTDRVCVLVVTAIGVTFPACVSQSGPPVVITRDSEIAWVRPSLDEHIGWKLCVDAHPCADLGPISARESNGTSQTYQSPFWSSAVAGYLLPGTHTLSVVVYKLADRTLESRRSAPLTVRVESR